MSSCCSCSRFFSSAVAFFRFVVSVLWSFFVICSESAEFCQNDAFVADCPGPDKAILITAARYGRMKLGDCVKTDFGFIGCSADVIGHVHSRCSGRRSCVIRVPDPFLDQTNPCNEDLINYFEATYDCITTALPESKPSSCDLSSRTERSTGYLSSLALPPAYKRCGSPASPWTITVFHGQRINVTLLDFSSSSASSPPAIYDDDAAMTTAAVAMETVTSTSAMTCDRYAVFQEGADQKALCGGKTVGESHAYLSSSNTVKVVLFHREEEGDYSYLLKYEAIGCSDVLETPSNVWFKRVNNHMEVGCHISDVRWRLTCVGNRWEGTTANCSLTSLKDARREDGHQMLSIGASILIILGVSLAIGLIVLLFGLFYMKRKHERSVLGQGIHMRDMKPLSSGASSEGHGAGSGGYARNTVFDPSAPRPMHVEKPAPAGRSGLSCVAAASAACNSREEGGSDYEYVWNMSPQLSSSGKHPKMRLRQQQQQQQQRGETKTAAMIVPRSGSDQNRPDLVSRLENVDGSPAERRSSAATRCTCGLDEARKAAAAGTLKPRIPPAEEDCGPKEEATPPRTDSPPPPTLPRAAAERFRSASGDGERNSLLETSPSSSSSLLLLHRTTPESNAAVVDSNAPSGTTRPWAAGDAEAAQSSAGGPRKVCRHCGHVVTDGSGSVRFAPGTGAAPPLTQGETVAVTAGTAALGSLSKRLTVKEQGKTAKRGLNASTEAVKTQQKR